MIVQLCMNVLVESGDGMKHVFCRKSRNIIVRRWVSEQINHITPSSLSPLCLLPTFQYDRCMYSFQYREPKNPEGDKRGPDRTFPTNHLIFIPLLQTIRFQDCSPNPGRMIHSCEMMENETILNVIA